MISSVVGRRHTGIDLTSDPPSNSSGDSEALLSAWQRGLSICDHSSDAEDAGDRASKPNGKEEMKRILERSRNRTWSGDRKRLPELMGCCRQGLGMARRGSRLVFTGRACLNFPRHDG
jgi:hypothetical protein